MPPPIRIAPDPAASLLAGVALRLRLNLAAKALVASVGEAAGVAAALLAFASLLLRLPSVPGATAIAQSATPAAVLPLLAVAVAVRAAMRLRRVAVSPLAAAIEIDRRLSLRERLSSATAAAEAAGGSADPIVAAWVRDDADRRTSGLRAAAVAPLRWPRGMGVSLLAIAAVALLLADLSRPRDRDVAAPPRAESVAVAARVAALSATIESAEAAARGPQEASASAPLDLEQSLAAIDAEAARLAQAAAAGDPAAQREAIEAAAELGSVAERLETLAESRRQAIEEFAASFEGLSPRDLPPLASGLAERLLEGEFDSAVEALEALARQQALGDRAAAEAIESLAAAIERLRQADPGSPAWGEQGDDSASGDAVETDDAVGAPDAVESEGGLESGLAAEEIERDLGRAADPQGGDGHGARDAREAPSGAAGDPAEGGDAGEGDAPESDAPPPTQGDSEPPAPPADEPPREPSWLDRFAEALRSLAAESGEVPPQPESAGSPPSDPVAGEEPQETQEERAAGADEERSAPPQPSTDEAAATRPEPSATEPDSAAAPRADDRDGAAAATAGEGRSPDGDRSAAGEAGRDAGQGEAPGDAAATRDADGGRQAQGPARGGADREGGDPGSDLLRRIVEEQRQVERWQRDARSLERLSQRLAASALRSGAAEAAAPQQAAARAEDRASSREFVEVREDEGPPGQRLATWLDLPSLPDGLSADAVIGDPAAAAAARRAAERAIEGGSVHPRHHAAVRRYFSRLESASPPPP